MHRLEANILHHAKKKREERQRLNRVYTKNELLKFFKGKFINVYPHYNYTTKETTFEVHSIKNVIWENHETPEEIINDY
mgnify:CR=1 FL=1|tara:strand:- start:489 stop:725 length:237 start_codon:yes stop_codon:yes gene_type:complete